MLRRAVYAGMIAACVAGFQLAPPCRHTRQRVAAVSMEEPKLAAETLAKLAEAKLAAVIGELAGEGATRAELEKSFKAALVAAYQPAAVVPSPTVRGELRAPATASDAQAAFPVPTKWAKG